MTPWMDIGSADMKSIRQNGATLIELLISVVISLIILASLLGMYVTSTANSSQTLKSSKLNQELTSLLTVMTNDIRRAGINGQAMPEPDQNPFWKPGATDIFIPPSKTSCILYSYDADLDGTICLQDIDSDPDTHNCADVKGDIKPDTNIYGFSLESGVVYMLDSLGAESHEIDDTICITDPADPQYRDDKHSVGWKPLTDPNTTRISKLEFSLAENCINRDDPSTGCPGNTDDNLVYIDEVEIRLQGELREDSSVKLNLGRNVDGDPSSEGIYVRVRNPRVDLVE